MKKLICLIISVVLLLGILSSCNKTSDEKKKFTESFIDYFDTVATVTGYEESVEAFNKVAEDIEYMLKGYHELFDIYNSYSGLNNIRTINENAGVNAVEVDDRIIDLLLFSKEIYTITKGKTNVTLGAVLRLWHDEREKGILFPESAALPEEAVLNAAGQLCGFQYLQIDTENKTVFITKKGVTLDVGAVAKGYATEKIAKQLEARGVSGYALNIGGNIRVIGDKPDASKWTAAVRDPHSYGYLMNINLDMKSFATSGSYQRFYTVNGKRYHHIINPETLYPDDKFSSVSVLTDDSGIADSLSTALFSMTLEEGKRLVKSLPDTEALWVTSNGEIYYSEGFYKNIIEE